MNVVTFIEELGRMCENNVCSTCPMEKASLCNLKTMAKYPNRVSEIVEEWSKENPLVTNKMKFEEVFGRDMEWITTNCDGTIPTVTMPAFIFTQDWWNEEYKGDNQ